MLKRNLNIPENHDITSNVFAEISDELVKDILNSPNFSNINQDDFPKNLSLKSIIKNNFKMHNYEPGDLVIREGDYGNSAFYIFKGRLNVVTHPSLPKKVLGRFSVNKQSIFSLINPMSHNKIKEYRDLGSTENSYNVQDNKTNLYKSPYAKLVFDKTAKTRDGNKRLLKKYNFVTLECGAILGEIAALGRTQRTATVFSEDFSQILEIRWQGLKEICKYNTQWDERINESYKNNILQQVIAKSPYFKGISRNSFAQLERYAKFESYGNYDWSQEFKDNRGNINLDKEPFIAIEGDKLDSIFVVASGFVRVSKSFAGEYNTLNYLKKGDVFGYDDIYDQLKNGEEWHIDDPKNALKFNLSALGYVHILRIPVGILKKYVCPEIKQRPQKNALTALSEKSHKINTILEHIVKERLINGTKLMMIDQDICTRCDECVGACSASHNNNPRFIRHGEKFENWMVASSCMHCIDPVCMIDCPTGAIYRIADGTVVIDDNTCIGCSLCSDACPYNSIQMVEIYNNKENLIIDKNTGRPMLKATKCDLCVSAPGKSMSCINSCSHNAIKLVDIQKELPNLIHT